MLVPPVNFALVVGQLYRSGHPINLNYQFLETLNLKTVIYVGENCPETISAEYKVWLEKKGINYIHFPSPSVSESFTETDVGTVTAVLKLIIHERNYPILMHSNKGKHRVGVIVAVVRKCLQQWCLTPLYEEYIRYAKGKADSDFLFIEHYEFEDRDVVVEHFPRWVMR